MTPLIIAVIVVAVLLIAVLWYFAAYNTFVRLRNLVAESWRQVDVELQRRHDLVPALVSTVKQAADFERSTLQAVVTARNAAADLTDTPKVDVTALAVAEDSLTTALTRLRALAENYPEVQAVENYAVLQRQLTDTEDRIAASRRLYNANVRALNTRIESIPASVVATIHRVERAEYFEISTPAVRDAIDVDRLFGGSNPSA